MLKFIGGPLLGINSGLSFGETALFTCLGMMSSVILFTTLLGDGSNSWLFRIFNKNPKLFTKKNRRKVKIWRNYGMKGVAFLTPIIFSPIGGTIVANSFGESRRKIYFYMFLSALFWSVTFSFILSLIRNGVINH
ncbi:MAG: hypothetical protein ACJ75J_11815 [Cytophagaceae bacterium]